MVMPDISVVIPLWNKESHVGNTIRSVIGQTYKEFEVIVVNDGATDRSPEIVRSFRDPRIRLIDQENAGTAAARNRGIAEARGELIAFIDSDDEWMPAFIETVTGLQRKYPEAGAFATSYVLKMQAGHFERPKLCHVPASPWEGLLPNYFLSALSRNPAIMPSSIMIRKDVLEKIGGFSPGVYLEDIDTWAKIAFEYPIAWSSRVGMIFHRDVSNSQMNTATISRDLAVIETLRKGLLNHSNLPEKDINNLIGHYYKFSAMLYERGGDRRNAIRCINKSIYYSRGPLLLKPLILRCLFAARMRSFDPIYSLMLLYRKYFYRIRE